MSRYDPGITDLHTRKLRYFIAVAEELHFSRAAAKLFLAQQALSRQIRELEDELGVPLFIRSTRKVELTAAGEVFLAGARAAVDALDEAVTMATRTNRAVTGTLRLGFFPGAALELTAPLVTEFRTRYPDVTIEMRESPVLDPSCGLIDGTSDLALVRLPATVEGLCTETLFTEPVVVGVSSGHPLAHRSSVTASELLDLPITLSHTVDPVYRSFWVLDGFRADGPAPQIVATSSITEEAQLVATGTAVCVTAAAAARYVPHPGIQYVLITDAPRSELALAWREGAESPLIERFRACALEVRDLEVEIVDLIENPYRATPDHAG
ncbi:LysR substrate-binding domain-containing protein [Nocardioides sp. WS12]|uniref:LysR substrate-binding domain-containing protein n=1 Tax=Nocardioides sp. WS12 TaxID=2486272 RepID=UPI00191D7A9C|nr:LysR substrate-binding domain-containing protein [Nocardioides sp. WS12]